MAAGAGGQRGARGFPRPARRVREAAGELRGARVVTAGSGAPEGSRRSGLRQRDRPPPPNGPAGGGVAVRGGAGGTGALRARGVASPRGLRGDDAAGLGRVRARRGSLTPRGSRPVPGGCAAEGPRAALWR